jgi:hypothetical protein
MVFGHPQKPISPKLGEMEKRAKILNLLSHFCPFCTIKILSKYLDKNIVIYTIDNFIRIINKIKMTRQIKKSFLRIFLKFFF